MYQVILIDDAQSILQELCTVIRWADYNCQVIGTANTAAEGMTLIQEKKPDIVFTNQDGLSMLGGLVSSFPNMQITVLTQYRCFSYAQEAIRLGVTRFLLKPIQPDEIHEALKAMTDKLNKIYPPEPDPAEQHAAGSFIVNQAVSFMQDNYSRKLTLQDVASHCFVSQWHLSKLLNRQTGKSFYDLLNSIRIDNAKALLHDPSLKIGDIVEMVGFSDNAHFARVFKKLVGISANEYRNRL